jgi:molybdopterin-guanine dinucleotide biosynthesis protein A
LDISCIVLAGGKSKRLGRNKVVEIIGKQSLLERVVSRLSSFGAEIIIVAAKDSNLPQLADYPAVKVIQDIYPGRGSLGGIYTGLKASGSFHNLVVAGDMPFLNLRLLRYMLDVVNGYDAVVPRVSPTIFEPLHAIYSKNCVLPLERLILENKFMILELYPLVKVKYVETGEIDRFDPGHLSFFNINTEADLIAGRELERKGDV